MNYRKIIEDRRVLLVSGLVILAGIFAVVSESSLPKKPIVTPAEPNVSSSDIGEAMVSNSSSDYSREISRLTETEYYITQENGTEPAFENQYYDHKKPGIYVDVVSGAPLFSSKHKYDSGTGWPAFYKPLEPDNLITRKDRGPLGVRTEVASKDARSHLGHIFEDGPDDKTGLRYCINSAALDFIPAEDLEEEGYGEYVSMFETTNSTQGDTQ